MPIFFKRARILRFLREFLDARGFLEVETPVLQPLAGGALARPFRTDSHVLGAAPLELRVAPELYLKQLIIGGFERVYEIGKCFRNEGLSFRHNPEFTSLEFYQAYASAGDLLALTKALLTQLVT